MKINSIHANYLHDFMAVLYPYKLKEVRKRIRNSSEGLFLMFLYKCHVDQLVGFFLCLVC